MDKRWKIIRYLDNLEARCANLMRHPQYKKPTAKGRRLRSQKVKWHCKHNRLLAKARGDTYKIPQWVFKAWGA